MLAGRAFIAETPIDRPGDDRKNVATLWKLIGHEIAASGQDGTKPRRKAAKAKVSRAKASKQKARRAKGSK
jgi:hypothetical protein